MTAKDVHIENQERVRYLDRVGTDIQKLLHSGSELGKDTLFLLPEIKNDLLKLPYDTITISEKLNNRVIKKKNCARKMKMVKDRCLSQDKTEQLQATCLPASQFFVPPKRFKDVSMTVPELHETTSTSTSTTCFADYVTSEPLDLNPKQDLESNFLHKCEKVSETLYSSEGSEDKSGAPNDLPSSKQLRVIQENVIEQISNFFTGIHQIQDYDMENLIFINNFFGKEKVYRGTQYLWILTGIRWRCHLRFVHVNMSVTSASSNPEDGTVKVFWQIAGLNQTTFIKKMWQVFTRYSSAVVDNAEHYSGVSVFHVNKDGKIYRHRVDRMDRVKEAKPLVQPEMAMA